MKSIQHKCWEIARKLNYNLYHTGYESVGMQKGYVGIYKRIKDARYKPGYRLKLIAKFVTYEAAYEYIVNNILKWELD